MMDSRIAVAISAGIFLVVAASISCTDTPPIANQQCGDGEIYDRDNGGCIPSNNDTGPDTGPNGDTNQQNGVDNSTANNHPHANQDELEPFEDESGDGVPNQYDNCPYVDNSDQTDTDGDGVGDACDNCPHTANPDQEYSNDNKEDERGITRGDACEPGVVYVDTVTDEDGDGVPDVMDTCPDIYSPAADPSCGECDAGDPYCPPCNCTCEDEYPCENCQQVDSDGDGVGDACDNCPHTPNPQQASAPGNPDDERGIKMGDACAPSPDTIPICDDQASEFEVLAPNVYIAFDLSTSMDATDNSGVERTDRALDGLDIIAEELHDEIRFGLGTFPDPDTTDSCDTAPYELAMGDHSESTLTNTWQYYDEDGSTPLLDLLQRVNDENLISDSGDPNDDQRIKAILLVTDGAANCAGTNPIQQVTDEIQEMHDQQGIFTFVVGFELDDDSLAGYADAGGTEDHYLASNANDLADAMRDVADLLVSCDYALETTPEDPNKIWVNVDGEYLDRDSYSYDQGSNTVSLDEPTCEQVRNSEDEQLEVNIELGCETECVPEEPQGLCDQWYESCGEDVCDTCEPEICNGEDDNCNGVEDEGCPECQLYEQSCESTDDCCEPFVCTEEGTCGHECYPDGANCLQNSDCCSDICNINSGDDVGTCVSG